MSVKTQTYSDLADKTSRELTHSVNEWCMFLKCQARLYKYNYADQLMIYAQRPDASLCLDFDAWAKTMNRYVHKGSKGIGLVDNSSDEPKMKYVFDISDTSEKFNSRPLHIWKIDKDGETDISRNIADFYGMEKSGNLDDVIYKACRREAKQYVDAYMKDFDYTLADSFLEEYDEDNRYKSLYTLAKSSIAYVAMERCGIDPESWFTQEDFMGVFEFNTPDVINFLGTCVSECSENVLRLVEKAEKNYERNKANDLHNERQSVLSPAEPEQSGKTESGQIRTNEETVPENKEEMAVEQSGPEGTAEQSPERSSDESRETAESGNDGIGDTEQGNLQLNLFGQPFGDAYDEEAENKFDKLFSASAVITEEKVNAVLRQCDNTTKARMMVAAEFSKDKPIEDKVSYLKEIYHGGYGLSDDGSKMCAFFDDEGMHINGGTKALAPGFKLFTWEQVAEKIDSMLDEGTFTCIDELKEAPSLERHQLAESIWYLERDLSDNNKDFFTSLTMLKDNNGFNDEVEALANAMKDKSFVTNLDAEFKMFADLYSRDNDLLRFHFHKVNKISERISDLLLPRKEYSSSIDIGDINKYGTFITEDEIDKALCGGSGVSQGKMRITEFFRNNKGLKERADFLKNEYGIGGSSHAVSGADHSGESHDAKGVILTKAKTDSKRFSWSDIAKKIDFLIKDDKYLNADEKVEYEAFLKRNESVIDKTQIMDAMRAAGYEFNEIESYDDYLIFNGEMSAATFKNWNEASEWINGVVFDDPAVTKAVGKILHPEDFAPDIGEQYSINGTGYEIMAVDDGKIEMAKTSSGEPFELSVKEFHKKEPEIIDLTTANIKEWYCKNYPDDELGNRIKEYKTFKDICTALDYGDDFYETIGVGDSIVRERIFAELAGRVGVDYNTIYNKWLGDNETKELNPSELKGNPIEKYEKIKENYPNHICLIQVGEFYECFNDDAKKVSKALDLVLTGRAMTDTNERIPMCGFPMHNEDLYMTKLAEKGLMPVAIARTMADKVMTKENSIPEDAVARAKPSVIKKLEENKKLIDSGKTSKEKSIKEER